MSCDVVLNLIASVGFFALAIWISIVDVRTHLIRNLEVVVGFAFLLLIYSSQLLWSHNPGTLYTALLGAVINGLFYWLLRFVIPGQLGAGDPAVAALAGLYLGHFGLGAALLGLVLPYATSAIPALIVLARKGRKARMAFAPFILLSTPLSLLIFSLYAG